MQAAAKLFMLHFPFSLFAYYTWVHELNLQIKTYLIHNWTQTHLSLLGVLKGRVFSSSSVVILYRCAALFGDSSAAIRTSTQEYAQKWTHSFSLNLLSLLLSRVRSLIFIWFWIFWAVYSKISFKTGFSSYQNSINPPQWHTIFYICTWWCCWVLFCLWEAVTL